MAAATVPLKDRIQQQYSQLLDNFTNLLRSARLPDDASDAGARAQGQVRVPSELLEVFAEKMLQACHALLAVVAELKRNALLNDVQGRNEEVAASAAEALAEAEQLEQRFLQLQQRIDAAMQLVPPLPADAPAAAGGGAAGATQQAQQGGGDAMVTDG
ncbi:N-lysine methyltransferase METTL21A [Chlorella sorokiniana]|uniref:N-lysine methyltransferase METTL21A n=1 Tax=Chlorella sorokiniana TaxID=3076 RepID=A0A2P6TM00_CHLSO|nr:N-lysine methyltransferase METTL21A [Chlorella sorokiniana]|eukprot:PRW45367.1 N-lysine methyltransferase METTL21A [Chlorella sorokiniana]